MGEFLDKLHADLREAEAERLRLQAREQELEREKTLLAAEGKQEQQTKIREMEKKLETLLRDFEYHAREAVNAIQDRAAAQKLSKDAERRIAKCAANSASNSIPPSSPTPAAQTTAIPTPSLSSSSMFRRRYRQIEVDRPLGSDVAPDRRLSLRSGNGRDEDEDRSRRYRRSARARAGPTSPVKAARARGISVSLRERRRRTSPSEINVIGHNVDEATREVEKFVDRAFLAGLPRVRVVHGSGMGILRKALRQSLQQHPHVDRWPSPRKTKAGAGPRWWSCESKFGMLSAARSSAGRSYTVDAPLPFNNPARASGGRLSYFALGVQGRGA